MRKKHFQERQYELATALRDYIATHRTVPTVTAFARHLGISEKAATTTIGYAFTDGHSFADGCDELWRAVGHRRPKHVRGEAP
jgi:hypothetical protein